MPGETGAMGPIGPTGAAGEIGPVGPTGPRGLVGPQGLMGPTGAAGLIGPTGPQGIQGESGSVFTIVGVLDSTGQLPSPVDADPHDAYIISNNLYVLVKNIWTNVGTFNGVVPIFNSSASVTSDGSTPSVEVDTTNEGGVIGLSFTFKNLVGPTGPQGVKGAIGPTGPQGLAGLTGPTGPRGVQGLQGPTGATGATGLTGETGAMGPTGPQGLKGDKGDTGNGLNIVKFYANTTDMNADVANVAAGDIVGVQNGEAIDLYKKVGDSFTFQATFSNAVPSTTVDIDCDHQYEITGETGHEYGVAIDDQQLILKKIQGQTRRYSLNLLNFNDTSVSGNGLTATYDNDSNIIRVQGTLTDTTAYLTFGINDVSMSNKTFTFAYSGSLVQGAHIQLTERNVANIATFTYGDSNNTIYISNSTNTANGVMVYFTDLTSGTSIDMRIQLSLVEGNTQYDSIDFKSYDDTLVNSRCNLLSTHTNLCPFRTITNNTAPGIILPAGTYTFIFTNTDIYNGLNILDNSTRENLAQKSIFYDAGPAYLNFTLTKTTNLYFNFYRNNNTDCMLLYGTYSSSNPVNEYIPYIEESYPVGIVLDAYDYIDVLAGKQIKQTSDVFTFDGSSGEEFTYDETSGYMSYDTRIQLTTGGISNKLTYDYTSTTNALGTFWVTQDTRIIFGIKGSNITSVDEWKTYLQSNPIQVVCKLAAPTTTDIDLPAGYAVYHGGLQEQIPQDYSSHNYLPYVLTKEYSVGYADQIKANIEIDRLQQSQLDSVSNTVTANEEYLPRTLTLSGTTLRLSNANRFMIATVDLAPLLDSINTQLESLSARVTALESK